VIQLANRSVAHPTGLIEDVLVWVGELIFPIDFYILDMEEGFSRGSVPNQDRCLCWHIVYGIW